VFTLVVKLPDMLKEVQGASKDVQGVLLANCQGLLRAMLEPAALTEASMQLHLTHLGDKTHKE